MCSSCSSKKTLAVSDHTETVSVSTTTENVLQQSTASAISNLSLHLDSLEMWLFPGMSFRYGDPVADSTTAAAVAEQMKSIPGYFDSSLARKSNAVTPVLLRAKGVALSNKTEDYNSSVSLQSRADSSSHQCHTDGQLQQNTDTTTIAKPPDTKLIFVALASILIAFIVYLAKKYRK